MYLRNKILLAFTFVVSILLPTAWSAEDFPKEGGFYKIKNQQSGNCLNGYDWRSAEKGKGTPTMDSCPKCEHTHMLWSFEKVGEQYKIKNRYSGNCLSYGSKKGNGSAVMQPCDQDEHASYRLWSFEKDGEYYKIKNQNSSSCLNSWKDRIGIGTVNMQPCAQDGYARWGFEKQTP